MLERMDEKIVIRTITRKDNEAVAKLIRTVLTEFKANKQGTVYYDPTTDNLYDLFQKERAQYWVAEYEGEIAGGSGVYPTEGLPVDCCELVKLYVSSQMRGKGLGKALIQKCFESAKQFGYKKMYLETMPELSTAVGLYEKLGFTYLKKPLGNSGHFGCDIWMLKEL